MMTERKETYDREPDYEKLYFRLFNAITDAPELLAHDEVASASIRLATAQYFVEEAYINSGE